MSGTSTPKGMRTTNRAGILNLKKTEVRRTSGNESETSGESSTEERKRKISSPRESETEKDRMVKKKKEKKVDEKRDEEASGEEGEEDEDETICEKEKAKGEDEKEWGHKWERAIENANLKETKRMLSEVMKDYRKQAKELKEEKERMRTEGIKEWKSGLDDLKHIIEQNNRTMRELQEEEHKELRKEIGNLRREIEGFKKDKERVKGEEEKIRQEVEDLKIWKEECEKRKKAGEKNGTEPSSGASGTIPERDNAISRLEWIEEDREREKRRNNIIIKGLENKEKCSKEWLEQWLRTEINTEVKIKKIWETTTKREKRIIGAQCEEENMKRKVMENKNRLGQKKIYIEHDLTWVERRTKEKAREKAAEYWKKGEEALMIGNRKVKTTEGTWTWSERKESWFFNKEEKLKSRRKRQEKGE